MPHTIPVGARSFFITCLGWLCLALGVAASVLALVQGACVSSLVAGEPALIWLGQVLPWALRAVLALSLALLGCSVGLLLRLDWARRLFIGLMVLALLASLGGLGLQQALLQSLGDRTLGASTLPPQMAGLVAGFVTTTRAMAGAMSLALSAALLWVIGRLMSAPVRHEFA